MADELNTQVEGLLRSAQVSNDVRSQAWRSFFSVTTPAEFRQKFDAMGLPKEVKSSLWKLKFPQANKTPQDNGSPQGPPPPSRSSDSGRPWYSKPIVPLSGLVPKTGPQTPGPIRAVAGAARGLAEGAEQLTTPANIGMMSAIAAGGSIPYVGPVVKTGAQMFFTAEMAGDIVRSIPEARQAYAAGDWDKLGQIVGHDVVTALFAGAGAKGVRESLKGGKPTSSAQVTPAGTRRGPSTPPPPPPPPPPAAGASPAPATAPAAASPAPAPRPAVVVLPPARPASLPAASTPATAPSPAAASAPPTVRTPVTRVVVPRQLTLRPAETAAPPPEIPKVQFPAPSKPNTAPRRVVLKDPAGSTIQPLKAPPRTEIPPAPQGKIRLRPQGPPAPPAPAATTSPGGTPVESAPPPQGPPTPAPTSAPVKPTEFKLADIPDADAEQTLRQYAAKEDFDIDTLDPKEKESLLLAAKKGMVKRKIYEQAAQLAKQGEKITTSFLQKHYKLGYGDAQKTLDNLVSDGVIQRPTPAAEPKATPVRPPVRLKGSAAATVPRETPPAPTAKIQPNVQQPNVQQPGRDPRGFVEFLRANKVDPASLDAEAKEGWMESWREQQKQAATPPDPTGQTAAAAPSPRMTEAVENIFQYRSKLNNIHVEALDEKGDVVGTIAVSLSSDSPESVAARLSQMPGVKSLRLGGPMVESQKIKWQKFVGEDSVKKK